MLFVLESLSLMICSGWQRPTTAGQPPQPRSPSSTHPIRPQHSPTQLQSFQTDIHPVRHELLRILAPVVPCHWFWPCPSFIINPFRSSLLSSSAYLLSRDPEHVPRSLTKTMGNTKPAEQLPPSKLHLVCLGQANRVGIMSLFGGQPALFCRVYGYH